jgi:hypothetical protein
VTILVPLICLRILSFMLAQNMLRLIITLSEIELSRRRFRFILFPLGINLPMSSLSHFLLLRLLLFFSSFGLILHPQLEGAYYRMYLYRKYCIENIVDILLCGNLHHCYCILPYVYTHTHTHIYIKGWLIIRLSLLIILNSPQ